ncbi:RDD family protein [Thermodesulfobacteriota bacterium]
MSDPFYPNSANFVSRIMAFAIDFIILQSIHFLLFVLLADKLMQSAYIEPLALLALLALFPLVFLVVFLLLHMVYFTLFHALSGQTIGKMIMGIKVVGDENKPASLAVAFLRWSGYILSFVPLAVGFLWAAVDKEQCAWHDRLARTRVISTEMT